MKTCVGLFLLSLTFTAAVPQQPVTLENINGTSLQQPSELLNERLQDSANEARRVHDAPNSLEHRTRLRQSTTSPSQTVRADHTRTKTKQLTQDRPPRRSQKKQQQEPQASSLLSQLNEEVVDKFLASPEAVQEFVQCFEKPAACPSKNIRGFMRDLPRVFRRGGRCVTCSPAEDKRLRRVLGKAIAGLQQRHRKMWNRLVVYVADYI